MATITPRRSTRIPHTHTPKMSERKKGLFQSEMPSRDSLTQHRRVPVVNSESDSDDCDLGIISALDTSSGDEKQNENAPKTPTRNNWPYATRSHSKRLLKETHDLKNFIKSPFTLNKYQNKGVLSEQSTNITTSPVKLLNELTKMDMGTNVSPTQMLRTPQNTTDKASPPKLSHRKAVVEIEESPETKCDSEKSHKRLRNESVEGPYPKYPKLDLNTAPKARLSLFNTDKLREILSTKSFYGKTSPPAAPVKQTPVVASQPQPRRHSYSHQSRRRVRRPGQINLGVRHRVRRPILHKGKIVQLNRSAPIQPFDRSANSATEHNSSQEIDDKIDPFDREKQTIANLLSQWDDDDEEPEPLAQPARAALPCFGRDVMEQTLLLQPVTAVPVAADAPAPSDGVIVELGANCEPGSDDVVMSEASHASAHGAAPRSALPVDGGFIFVEDEKGEPILDLDALELEMQQLDASILNMAKRNNMDPEAVMASVDARIEAALAAEAPQASEAAEPKLFPIFSHPNPGTDAPAKQASSRNKPLLKSMSGQYAIDAGQRRLGATQCTQCGVIYEIGDPEDEHDHLVHHNATDVLRYNGTKDEQIVGQFGSARVVLVRGGAGGWRRVRRLQERLLQPQLGCAPLPNPDYTYTAFLYIEKRLIVGVAVLEAKSSARRLLPGEPDCASDETYPVKCGVVRLWSHASHRRRGVAARLLDCARASLLLGQPLSPNDVAFSAPTAAGKAFAAKYTGTDSFYVYLD